MIGLLLYDYIFHTNTLYDRKIHNQVEIFRNMYALIVNVYVTLAVSNYFLFSSVSLIMSSLEHVFINLVIDLFFIKKFVVYIHHLVAFLLYYLFYTYELNIYLEISAPTLTTLMLTELSSVFLSIRELMKRLNIKEIRLRIANDCMFVITFFATRIWYFSKHFSSEEYHSMLVHFNLQENSSLRNALTILFVLNAFWFGQIVAYLLGMRHQHQVN
jgi:hypothetical protein